MPIFGTNKRGKGKKHKIQIVKQQTGLQEVNSLDDIAAVIKELKFKKSWFGADERDVWIKLRRLDEMYRRLYQMQEIKYQTLLAEYKTNFELSAKVKDEVDSDSVYVKEESENNE